ncbi:MAG: glycosyltransferase family 2 protein [Chitinophagales bacterium]
MSSKSPKVAVVILNWNGIHFLQKFLPSVLASKYKNLDIYLADNASTDESVAFVGSSFPSIRIIQNAENYGFARGYNEALKQVEADYYVLLNSDVEVTENWIHPIIDLMESNKSIAACQPKILAFHHKTQFEYAGAAGGMMDRFGYTFCRGRFFDHCEEDVGQYEDISEVFWASGAALFIRANLYHEIGGLDGDFFAHMEEIDLCWRLKRAGYRIFYHPNSAVYHVGGGTLPQGNPRKLYLNFRNSLAMMYKNLTTLQLFTLFPFRIALDLIAALKFLLSGDFADCKATLKAQFNFFSHLLKWQRKRSTTQKWVNKVQISVQPNQLGWYKGSIVVDYFLKGKKKSPMNTNENFVNCQRP